MRLWQCDDDGGAWDDSHICWDEIEEFTGPEYLMWRDRLDAESPTPTWRPAGGATSWPFVSREDWRSHVC